MTRTTFLFPQKLKAWLKALTHIFFPDLCYTCNRTLMESESFLCSYCICKLPLTNYHLRTSHLLEQQFRGKFPYEKVTAFLHFEKDSIIQEMIHQIKYRNGESLGRWAGNLMAEEIISSGFFNNIDVIVPVPLHRKKLKERGYNQAEVIAQGVAEVCKLPINRQALQKVIYNTSQTKKGRYERWLNSEGAFKVTTPEDFAGKHVLLIDDVITTGATISMCAQCIRECAGVRISVLSLAATC